MIVAVLLATFQGLSILTVRSMVTSDLRRTVEQIGRDIELAQEAPAVPSAISCGAGVTQSSVSLVLVGPIPGVGAAGADCVVYRCNPSPGEQPGPCNNMDPNVAPNTLGVLERLVYDETGALVGPIRPMARGVFSLSVTLNGAPATLVRVQLGVRWRMQNYPAQGQLVTLFNLRN